jgi:hypothetical protein
MPLGRFGWLAVIALAAIPPSRASDIVVDVFVVDAHNVAVPGADVSIVRELNKVAAHGVTDDNGRRRLTISRSAQPFQIIARKIGFERGDQFLVPVHDTITARIVLHPAPQALPGVTVTAEENLKRLRYHVDADDIASSDRPILDALDVVTKLRPDMIYPPQPKGMDPCGLFYVWVNGKRVVSTIPDPFIAARTRQQRSAAKATPRLGGGLGAVSVNVQTVLSSIHPEHVEEMTYSDCDDFTVNANFARNAVFVTLKPGVGFEPNVGSFVIEDWHDSPDLIERPSSTFRSRILGVYDGSTGDPVAGAAVVDVVTGTYASTTGTGTVSLAFLREGTSTITIHKPGYSDLTMDVSISPRDTTPLTVVVSRP